MRNASLNLTLYYGGFGLVLFLAWAAVMSDLVEGDPPRWTYAATTALRVVGVLHPVAAIAAWDLRHQQALRRSGSEPVDREAPMLAFASLAIAVIVASLVGRL